MRPALLVLGIRRNEASPDVLNSCRPIVLAGFFRAPRHTPRRRSGVRPATAHRNMPFVVEATVPSRHAGYRAGLPCRRKSRRVGGFRLTQMHSVARCGGRGHVPSGAIAASGPCGKWGLMPHHCEASGAPRPIRLSRSSPHPRREALDQFPPKRGCCSAARGRGNAAFPANVNVTCARGWVFPVRRLFHGIPALSRDSAPYFRQGQENAR